MNNVQYIASNVAPSTGKRFVYKNSTTTQSIIDRILQHDADAVNYVRTVAPQFKAATVTGTAKNIYKFLRTTINYVPDGSRFQDIKSPGKFIETRTGDCKSYSHFTAGVLRALNIPYAYRFTAYAHGDFTHVYIVAFDEHGHEVIIDAVPGNSGFNKEKPYLKKKDYMATVRYIAGISRKAVKGSRKNVDGTFSYKNYKKQSWSGYGAHHGGLRGVPVNSSTVSFGPGAGAASNTQQVEPDVPDMSTLNQLVIAGRAIPVQKALNMLNAYKIALVQQNLHLRKDYNLVVFVDAIIAAIMSGNMQKVKNTIANYFAAEAAVKENIRNERNRDSFWEKAGDAVGDVGRAVLDFSKKTVTTIWRGIKMWVGAPARTAFISLVRLNVFGLGTKFNQANNRNRNSVKAWWTRMGAASFAPLEQAINLGAKEKRILGIGATGVEEIAAIIGASTPVLIASIEFLKSAGVDTSDMETAANDAATKYNTKYSDEIKTGTDIFNSANKVRQAFNDATRVPAQQSFSKQIDAILAKDAASVARIWNAISPDQQQVILSVMTPAQKELLLKKLKDSESGSSTTTGLLIGGAALAAAYFIFKSKK